MCRFCLKHNPFKGERAHEVYRDVQILQSKAKAQAQLQSLKNQRHALRLQTSKVARGKERLFHDGNRARKAYSGGKKGVSTLRSIWKHL